MKSVLSLLFIMFVVSAFNLPDDVHPQYKEGIIKDYNAMGNGCEWLIEIDGKLFRPKNLKENFKKDGLRVKIDFEYSLTLFSCPAFEEKIQEVNITWIELSGLHKGQSIKIKGEVKSN